jgi:hypothetical protein
VKQRRLTGARGADDREQLSFIDRKTHSAKRLNRRFAGKDFGHLLKFENGMGQDYVGGYDT